MSHIKTACFSGYRPEKFSFPLNSDYPEYVRLLEAVRQAILKAVDDGYGNFMVGMAGGFDLTCASIFFELKEAGQILKDVRLTAILPFAGHRPTRTWVDIHQSVLEEADEVVTIAPKYYPQVFFARNRYMVEHSSRLICYYTGLTGGTAYTVRYALKSGLRIVNVAELKGGNDPVSLLSNGPAV